MTSYLVIANTAIMQQHGHRVEVIAADLSNEQGVALVLHEVERRGLTIDLLVNSENLKSE